MQKQKELFNGFGQAEINCESCSKILPQNTEKTGNYYFCAKCADNYVKNLEVF